MSEIKKEFVGYEYKEVLTDSDQASFFLDCYEAFGWELDDRISKTEGSVRIVNGRPVRKSLIRLKRNRKIINKMELTRLQRNFEHCIQEIDQMEHSKRSVASMYSISIGTIGTVFMAGSVFAVTATPPIIWLCIVLAIPAFIGWILPYFIYKKIQQKQTEKVTPYIEAKYDEIYEICEKGNKLL